MIGKALLMLLLVVLPETVFDGLVKQNEKLHYTEEQSACTSHVKRYAPGKEGRLVEAERFAPVPGHESEIIPKPESLSCLIMEGWTSKDK